MKVRAFALVGLLLAVGERASAQVTVIDPANSSVGRRFTVVANHFKSKGCPGTGADADTGAAGPGEGKGQGTWSAAVCRPVM